MMKNVKKENQKLLKRKMTTIILGVAAALAATAILIFINNGGKAADTADINTGDGNITIVKSEVTEDASFYPYQSGDTYMEIIAIRASDGTVRTALNTCQICYNSGRGYYEQEGDVLVCQNCGNRFTVDQVEVIKGGCNPVPISEDEKTDDGETITISGEVLNEYSVLFSKWKKS